MSDDKNTDIKDGLYVFYHETTTRSLKEMFPQCRQFVDLLFATSSLGIVSFPHYIRLGSKLMCMVEKGQAQDWKKVKRN
eukprot:12936220-Ditylum_brightwellii.AAC.1